MSLWSLDQSRSITNIYDQVKNIKIYESITDPFMTAVFSVVDAIGMVDSFPMIGEEYIELDIETPGMDEVFTLRFDIVDIKDKITLPNNKGTSYNLYGISKEFRKNVRILKEIHNNIDPITLLKKLFRNLESDKDLNTGEGTYAKLDIDVSKLRPLEAIDKLRLYTRNIQELSSAFCFFETKNGFNFYSVEQMFASGKTKIGDKIFFFNPTTNLSIYENNFRNIIGMTRISEAAPMTGAIGGQLNAKLKTFDIITGELIEKNYKDSEQSAGFIYADDDNSPLRSNKGQVDDGAEEARSLLNISDSSKNDPNIQEAYLERASYISKLVQQLFRMEVYGDLALNVGDVIEINLPNPSGLTDGSKIDQRFSGNFLISRMVNNIDLTGKRPLHSITCEVIKGNLKS